MEFQRIKRLPPYVFSIIDSMKMEARHRGEDIVDFGMGNPDLPTPPHVVAKLVDAASKPANHRYSVSRGIYKLRVAITDWYKKRYKVDLDPDFEAIVTIGAKEGISHLAWATIDPGDVVLCPTRPIRFTNTPWFWQAAIYGAFRSRQARLFSVTLKKRFARPGRNPRC